ncbi:aspartate aminotransferase family protein [Dysgonomonas sp. Marseille-P4677]|uniref:class-III pyridoxal-phosphate-dependent aminotransferase n=1 Tax=Dysgonomonas sp. Marseille-P4677 TaxID=2364790 RepID=UPI001912FBFF|nr:aspartate aminotransferase family protein [Dysgonomonas sp. Marseille-P4677]MBK5722878.1 aspartate aminotransferase family protein [Dysgonomonas sp. Marseille-P4677]
MIKNIIPFYISSEKLIVKSEDCYQFDSDGKRYIDFESGVWCTNIGHSNKYITNLIASQAEQSIHHGYKFRNEFAEMLSKELQRIIGIENGASVFLSSGSEAVNLAIVISQHIINRKKILKIDNTYLSAYGFGQISTDNEYITNVRYNDIESIKKINFKEIACLVLETGGASIDIVQFPEYSFVKELVDIAKLNGCIIIAEEVTTGMGRTGKWFGFQHYDIIPDIIVIGKAIGNGYPVSAVTISNKINREFCKNPFRYAQSHQNDPLGCAIGLEVIKYIEKNNLIDRSNTTGKYFKEQLESLKNKYKKHIKSVRARGLMFAMEFTPTINIECISNKLFEKGIIIGYKHESLRFLPPLTIKQSDIDVLIKSLDELLSNKNRT